VNKHRGIPDQVPSFIKIQISEVNENPVISVRINRTAGEGLRLQRVDWLIIVTRGRETKLSLWGLYSPLPPRSLQITYREKITSSLRIREIPVALIVELCSLTIKHRAGRPAGSPLDAEVHVLNPRVPLSLPRRNSAAAIMRKAGHKVISCVIGMS